MNWTLSDAVIIALISAFVALVTLLLNSYIAKRRWPTEKAASEAASSASEAASSASELNAVLKLTGAAANFAGYMEELTARLTQLEKRNRELEADLVRLRQDLVDAQRGIRKLEHENTDLKRCNVLLSKQVQRLRQLLMAQGLQHLEDADGENTGCPENP